MFWYLWGPCWLGIGCHWGLANSWGSALAGGPTFPVPTGQSRAHVPSCLLCQVLIHKASISPAPNQPRANTRRPGMALCPEPAGISKLSGPKLLAFPTENCEGCGLLAPRSRLPPDSHGASLWPARQAFTDKARFLPIALTCPCFHSAIFIT